MQISGHDLGAYIIVGDDAWLLCGSSIEIESVFYFMLCQSLYFSLFYVLFPLFSASL